MTDDRDDPLLLAVEALTRPQRSKVMQGDTLVTVELPPLLQRLDDAIRSSMGGSTGGASLASQRSLADNDALYRMILIVTQLKDWCRMVGVVPTGHAAPDLTAWFLGVRNRTDATDSFKIRALTGWARAIESKLDPWRERELPDACPVCSASEWWNKSDGLRYNRPLIVRYKPDTDDLIGDAKGMCRACTQVWSARELAYAIEEGERVAG